MADFENLSHGSKAKVPQKRAEPALRPPQIGVVGKPNPQGNRDARARRIELPRMNVEHHRTPFMIERPQAQPGQRVWIDAEVGAPGNGQVPSEDPPRADRELRHRKSPEDAIGPPRRILDPVSIVQDRVDAGVIADPQLAQNTQRPQGLSRDRKEWSP